MTFGSFLSVVGYTTEKVNIRLSNLMAFAATAQGNWGCLPKYYPEILNLVLSKKIFLRPFIEFFPMSQINDVFEQLKKHTITKRPILVPDFIQ
jgi:6-hydroxycyclohex-1-ene-1-carbonyl-CoA dehydrogenase